MDLNMNLSKRRPEYYEQIKALNDEDLFLVSYKSTTDRFALRKTDLKECGPDELQIFEYESGLTNRLKHKNLLPFVTSFISKTHLWTIMPFAEFQSLADLSRPWGWYEDAIALAIKDVLEAVQYLHNNCIIHHSIRCSHILLFGNPETEFRCILSGLKYSVNTIRSGQIVTPVFDYPVRTEKNYNWLAPEVLEQNLLGYDIKADIYSIGITCCELSNGDIPFSRLAPAEVLLNKLNGEITEPLDSNSKDLVQLNEEDREKFTEDDKIKYKYYLQKTLFSSQFKKFTKQCLNSEPEKRLNASQLLSHPFISKYEIQDLDKNKVFVKSIRFNGINEEIKKLI